jgi:hypothetical protein
MRAVALLVLSFRWRLLPGLIERLFIFQYHL